MRALALTLVAVAAAALAGFVIAERLGDDVIDELEDFGYEIEDSGSPSTLRSVSATAETEPVPSEADAADDPAIWIDRDQPDRSTVIGTDKEGGIAVYDLAGREVQYRPDGRINNVDLREGFPLDPDPVAIVAATNRSTRTVALYRVDPQTRELEEVAPEVAEPDLVVGGICLYRDPDDGEFGFFVTGSEGEVEQWTFSAAADGGVAATRAGEFAFESPTEACVVDDEEGVVYFGEEQEGIWRMPIEPGSDERRELIDSTDDDHLTADVEGLAIAPFPDDSKQLIASSQGSNSFAVYRLQDEVEHLYDFEVVDGDIDGAAETDGIEVTTESLGAQFPHGLLVVQDGDNDDGNQNFKLVPLCSREVVVCL